MEKYSSKKCDSSPGERATSCWASHNRYNIEIGVGDTGTPPPPYSPDLSPCDYYMFGSLTEALGGQRFNTDEEVEEFVRT
ncbi:unnamed protein product [Acanthoscelides obtectus]|uniref:Uncharacterized protein n=1 Tax=Acanthoscelides obtectus TaxID=200917 RepID=A0A9P0MGW9_ACAOB|nr:unnamed protein product [Acanthoscelides obtectus]CAK1668349.1 hypothetical protein AOBTE_LOCUS26341 [Acanthoscelides obtectus]